MIRLLVAAKKIEELEAAAAASKDCSQGSSIHIERLDMQLPAVLVKTAVGWTVTCIVWQTVLFVQCCSVALFHCAGVPRGMNTASLCTLLASARKQLRRVG